MAKRNNYWLTQAPFFLPDIGTFFNQDVIQAKNIVAQLFDAGVHTIKGEILHNPNICLKHDVEDVYLGLNSQKMIKENYRALIERKSVSLENYREIFTYAQSLGLKVIVSVYDFEGADFAKEVGCVGIKIATSNITHQPLIEHVAKLQLPMIIDTGGSTLEEITRAINWANDAGNHDILIEHSPPAPPEEVSLHNLNFMKTLQSISHLPVGLSDHHSGDEMLLAATALGAIILEKGVCSDNIADEQDSGHALKISHVKSVNNKINNIANALGDGIRELPRNRTKKTARMGLIAKRDIAVNESLSLENVTFAFPMEGIDVANWNDVKNFRSVSSINAGQPITWSDVQG